MLTEVTAYFDINSSDLRCLKCSFNFIFEKRYKKDKKKSYEQELNPIELQFQRLKALTEQHK